MASSRFILLGTGNSTGVPWLHCVMDASTRCSVCSDCVCTPTSKNVRNNPSALVSFAHPDGRTRNILIDCGKTFRDTVLKNFPKHGISHVDAVILTHPHADAYGGLDDLRDIAPRDRMPIFLSEGCFRIVSRAFAYLVEAPKTKGLFIAQLDWNIIRPWKPFTVCGMVVVPFPVEHGEPGPMLGFEFHAIAPPASVERPMPPAGGGATPAPVPGSRVVYISDIAAMPAEARAYLKSRPIDVLVLDALAYKAYPTHFGFKQAIACALDIGARRTLFVGMNHRVDYYAEQPKLTEFAAMHGTKMDLAHDGISIPVNWSRELSVEAVEAEVDAARALATKLPPPRTGGAGMKSNSTDTSLRRSALLASAAAAMSRIPTVSSAGTLADLEVCCVHPSSSTGSLVSLPDSNTPGVVPSSYEGDARTALPSESPPSLISPAPVDAGSPPGTSSQAAAAPTAEPADATRAILRLPSGGIAYTYEDIVLPEWEDGTSPSKSAEQLVSVHATK